MEVSNERKSSKFKIGGILVISFLVIYIPSFWFWIYGRTIDTDFIRNGTIEDAVNTEAYLIRNEEVLKSPFEGKCIPEVGEGEKIAANFRIATVMKEETTKLTEKIKELDLKIIDIQRQKSENQEFFSEDVTKIDIEVEKRMKVLSEISNSNNLTAVANVRNEIDQLLQKKALIMGNTGAPDANLNAIKREKENLQAQVNANQREIVSKVPGIVSFTVDGYEADLNPASIKNLTPKFLSGIKPKEPVRLNGIKTLGNDKPVAKIVKDIDYYAVFCLDAQKANTFKLGNSVKVRINDINKVLDGVVDFKSNEQEGKCILAVEMDKGISETANLRKVSADLIGKSYEGWKVPLKSLKDLNQEDMKARITLVKANSAAFREVKIKGKNDEYAVIENVNPASMNSVSLYDVFILNPANIQEGQLINP